MSFKQYRKKVSPAHWAVARDIAERCAKGKHQISARKKTARVCKFCSFRPLKSHKGA